MKIVVVAQDPKMLGNYKISRKSMKCLELKASAELDTQNKNFYNCARKLQKAILKHFTKKLLIFATVMKKSKSKKSFFSVADWMPSTLLKRDIGTGVFIRIFRNS